jgi:hypothetical protein
MDNIKKHNICIYWFILGLRMQIKLKKNERKYVHLFQITSNSVLGSFTRKKNIDSKYKKGVKVKVVPVLN